MKKALSVFFALFVGLFLTACNQSKTNTPAPKAAPASASASALAQQAAVNFANKKILIAYFSHSGNTEKIAKMIQAKTKGDLFKIEPAEPYAANYDECKKRAIKEQQEKARPKLAKNAEAIEKYDIIFVGYPNWLNTMPQILFTFIETHKLEGKTVIPFVTHGSGSWGNSLTDLAAAAPKMTLLKGISVPGKEVQNAEKDVNKWLDELTVGTK